MESSLTESEMDAVLQLIQLSGNPAHDFHVFWVNINPQRTGQIGDEIITEEEDEENREESVGETSSYSSAINNNNNNQEKVLSSELDDEALPRRRKKSRSIADIYTETRPSRRPSKRHKIPVFLGQ